MSTSMFENHEKTAPSLHLEEVWRMRSDEDQQKGLALFLHHAKVALIFLRKSALTSVLSIVSVATVLFILGLIVAIQNSSLVGINAVAGKLRMSVFMKDSSSDKEWNDLSSLVDTLPGLLGKKRLDKAAALKELRKILDDDAALLKGLDQDNPLPGSMELEFDVENGDSLPQYATTLKIQPGVDEVTYDGQLLKVISALGSKLKSAGTFTSLVLVGLTLFLIAATIRISLYHESDEIEIMGLVGANPAFIQAPFIIGGALQGFLGFVIAYACLNLIQAQIFGESGVEEIRQFAGLSFSLLGMKSAFLLGMLGVGAGIVGSYFASKRVS